MALPHSKSEGPRPASTRIRVERGADAAGQRSPETAPIEMLRPQRAAPAEAARATRAEINLAHVRHNLRELQAVAGAGGATTQVWAVLKADAYGHGARSIGVALETAGVKGLCVALLEEGIELRRAGVTVPILVMGGSFGRHRDGVEALLEHQLTPVVYDPGQIASIAATQRYLCPQRKVGVHLKLDTGMGRLGVREGDTEPVVAALRSATGVELAGLMTHLACADDEDLAVTHEQLAAFDRRASPIEAQFGRLVRHAANSAALLRLPEGRYDIVRPGLAVYGVHPCAARSTGVARAPRLRPAMRVLSEVVALRTIEAGEAIGYSHRWRAPRRSVIATVPMGYADGLPRSLTNRGHMLVAGQRAPIVGTVSMDLTMIDVTDVPGAAVRDEVVVLGAQRGRLGEDAIDADELAEHTGTIAWECLTSISRRVPRYYRQP